MAGNFVKVRRGILRHLQERRLTTHEFAVFQLLLLLADASTGVWWGDSVGLSVYLDMGQRAAKNALHGLKEKGYIRAFQQKGSRSTYPILIDLYEITVGALKGSLTNAEQTVDWRNPVLSGRTEDGPEVGPDSGPESGPPYSRSQENKTTREAISTPDTKAPDAPQVLPEAEPKANTPDAADPKWLLVLGFPQARLVPEDSNLRQLAGGAASRVGTRQGDKRFVSRGFRVISRASKGG